jgi:hypothetical protein
MLLEMYIYELTQINRTTAFTASSRTSLRRISYTTRLSFSPSKLDYGACPCLAPI